MSGASWPRLLRWSLVAALLVASLDALVPSVHASRLACGVCEAIVDEVNRGILETTATHSVQTRFRVDEKKRIPYARTEHNLLEIMEGDDFPRRFNSYGLVKPFTKTARQMRDAYRMAAEAALNAEPDATTDAAAPVDEAPAAPDTPASTTTTEGAAAADPAAATAAADAAPGTDAAAAAGSAAGADGAATTAAPAAAAAPLPPFRPSGPVPLSLSHNHVHLAFSSLRTAHGLHVETSSRVSSEIRSAVSDFLEEYLDAAVLLFHRDEADIKRKLCVDLSAACKPNQRKPKTKAKGAQADGKSAQATADADAAATTAKDEL